MNDVKGVYFDPENPGWGIFVGNLPGDQPGLAGILYLATDTGACEYPNFGADGVLYLPDVQGLPGATRYTGTREVGHILIKPVSDDVLDVTLTIESEINRGHAQPSPGRPYPYSHTCRMVRLL